MLLSVLPVLSLQAAECAECAECATCCNTIVLPVLTTPSGLSVYTLLNLHLTHTRTILLPMLKPPPRQLAHCTSLCRSLGAAECESASIEVLELLDEVSSRSVDSLETLRTTHPTPRRRRIPSAYPEGEVLINQRARSCQNSHPNGLPQAG